MWRILVLLLFAKDGQSLSSTCDCPGITINGTDQPYCWQIVDRNSSTWSSADDACGAVGGRMGQPADNTTVDALAEYLKPIFTLPVLTGYVVGNAQTGEIAIVCKSNEFFALANDTDELIIGKPSDTSGCVFITGNDYRMHYGPCDTAAVVLCSQPVNSDDYCAVAPTCQITTTTTSGYKTTTTSFKPTNTDDLDNSTTSTTFTTRTGTFSTVSTVSTTTGNDSIPDTTTLLPSTTTTLSGGGIGGGTGGTSTTKPGKSSCDAAWLFGYCIPWWWIALTAFLFLVAVAWPIWCCAHYIFRCCFCCKSHQFPKAVPVMNDVEKGAPIQKQMKAVQTEPQAEVPQVTLPPPVTQTTAIIPAPIPIDYHSMVDKPVTEDKGMMTDPWEAPEPVIIYRDRAAEPKVDYARDERMMLPPAPMTARSEAPQFMESDDESPINRRMVAGPTAVIVRPIRPRQKSPDIPSPRDPFPALPRRALNDDDLPMEPRQPKEKKKRTRPHLEPVVFQHNARPEDRPVMEEPLPDPAPSRGPRSFPPPPPQSRSSTITDRPFPDQFKSPSPGPPGPKASRPLPPPPSSELKRDRSPSPPAPVVVPPKQSRPLTRTPVSRPVITQEPAPKNDRRAAQPPATAAPLPPFNPPPSAKRSTPARSSSGDKRSAPAAPARARSSSPPRKAAPAPRAASPFAPKNSVAPAPQGGSLFKSAPSKESAANLRAANGKLGGVAGGHGEVPRGWKAWSPNARTFSATPGSDI